MKPEYTMPDLTKNPLKILLIQFRPAGDVLLLTPVVKAIKEKYPDSLISFLVNEKESILIRDFSLIDDIILIRKIPRKKFSDYIKYLRYNISLNLLVRKKKFDVVIDFIGNPKSAFITFFSRAPVRIGRKSARDIAYNNIIKSHEKNLNTVLRRLAHLKPIGIDSGYISTELCLNPDDRQFAGDYIKSLNIKPGRKLIILAPNSPRSSRRWKPEYFSEVGKNLVQNYNAKILLAWGPGEEEYTKNILKEIGPDAEMIPLTSLCEMAAIIAGSDLIITNDSGAMHMANAAGIRSIAIFGPTNPYVWNHPDMAMNPALRADVPCIQCEKQECPLERHLCMDLVTPDIVLKTVDKIFGNR